MAGVTGSYHVTSPPWLGLMVFTINVMLVSILFGWLRQKSGGIIAPTLAHACHNLAFAYFAGTSGAGSASLKQDCCQELTTGTHDWRFEK